MSEGLFDLTAESNVEEVAAENIENGERKLAEEEGNKGMPSPEWYWDEHRPGEGARPEWLASKYKSVEDQAKSYASGFPLKPPKRFSSSVYDFNSALEKYGQNISESDLGKDLAGIFDHYNASQEFVDALLDVYGRDVQARIPKSLSDIFCPYFFSEEEYVSLMDWGSQEENIKHFETLATMYIYQQRLPVNE